MAEKKSYWAKEHGFTVVTCPFLPTENDEVKLAAILAGKASKQDFIRSIVVEAARKVIEQHKIKR